MSDSARAKAETRREYIVVCTYCGHGNSADVDKYVAEQAATLRDQIDQLAKFIVETIPGEPSRSEGAVDTAIHFLVALREENARLRGALQKSRGSYHHEFHVMHGAKEPAEQCQSPVCQDATRALLADPEGQRANVEVERLRLKVRDADVVMAAIDDAIRRGALDARSPIADARLDYGDPKPEGQRAGEEWRLRADDAAWL